MQMSSLAGFLSFAILATGLSAQELPLGELPGLFPEHDGIARLFAADFDADGDDDLLVEGGPGIKLYLSNEGAFDIKPIYVPGSGDSTAVVVVDFNGDGFLDVLISIGYLTNVKLFDGASAFSSGPVIVGSEHFDIAAGDIDGDGDVDLFEARFDSSGLWLHRNQGDGTFALESFSSVIGEDQVDLVDLDGDGSLDLLVGAYPWCGEWACYPGEVRVFLNDGTGSFAETGSAPPVDEGGPNGFVPGDLDQDGDVDVIVPVLGLLGGASFVLLNNGDGTFTPIEDAFGPAFAAETAVVLDLGLDGDLDVYFRTPEGSRLFEHQGSGLEYVEVFDRLPPGCCDGTVAAGDLDGSGSTDLFFADGPTLLFAGADGRLHDATRIDDVARPHLLAFAPGDVDGDGALDAFGAHGAGIDVLYGTDEGAFASTGIHATDGTAIEELVPADIEGDGDLDVFALHALASDLLLRNDAGTFSDRAGTLLPPQPLHSHGGAFADVDGDGDGDLAVVTTNAASGNRLYLNDGSGTFALAAPSAFPQAPASGSICALDADLDGDIDLACNGGELLRNDGVGFFTASALPSGLSNPNHRIVSGDLDGDGYPELATKGFPRPKVAWNVAGSFPAVDTTTMKGVGDVTIGDVDADGDADLVAADGRANVNTSGNFEVVSLLTLGGDGPAPWIADLDRDGDAEVIFPAFGYLRGLQGHTAWRRPAGLGQPASIDVYGDPSAPYALLFALGTAEIPIPGLGTLWIDPFTLELAAAGTTDPGGHASFETTVPDVSGLLGLLVSWQSVTGATPRLTNRETMELLDL